MNYTLPINVISPKDCVGNLRVIFDGGDGSVSVAQLDWDDVPSIAIRWNVAKREWDDPEKLSLRKTAVGMPTSRGYPVWFILPPELLDRDSDLWRELEKLKQNPLRQ